MTEAEVILDLMLHSPRGVDDQVMLLGEIEDGHPDLVHLKPGRFCHGALS